MIECGQMVSTKEAIRHLEQSVAQRQRELRAQKPTDRLWEEFAVYRRAISMALLKEPIIGIESDTFLGTRSKIDKHIRRYGMILSTGVDETKLDLRVKTGTASNPLKTRIDISGICAINGQAGFIRIIATEDTQAEGFWSKNTDGSYSLEQVVKDSSVYMPGKLVTTDNKNHVIVPDTDIKFLKHIVDIHSQINEICC